jgi:hypothetical protein
MSSTIDWGNVPAWVSGIGSVGALAFLVRGQLRGDRLNREQREREDAQRALEDADRIDAAARPARLVTFAYALVRDDGASGDLCDKLVIDVTNDSDGPISDLKAQLHQFSSYDHDQQLSGMELSLENLSLNRSMRVPAHGVTKIEFKLVVPIYKDENFSITLYFTDETGRRWSRRDGRQPEPVLALQP